MNNFSYEANGYNKKEVNDFIDNVIVNTEKLVKKCNDYEKNINLLTKELNSYKSKEKELGESLIRATEISHTIRENALRERDSMLSSINEEKDKILKDAYQKLQDVELKRLTIIQNIQIYKEKLSFILKEQEKYLREIDIITRESE
jgi:septum site-determining protein divIVA